jgi:D-3-phosphoglycerate dehydrogenase
LQKVLITAKSHPGLAEKLKEKGFEVIVNTSMSYAELEDEIHDVTGLIVTTRLGSGGWEAEWN